MFGIQRVVIAQHERALYWQFKRFVGVLEPGVYWKVDVPGRSVFEIYDLAVPEFDHPRVDFMLQDARAELERHFQVVELSDRQVALVYRNGKLNAVLAPGTRQFYWRGPIDIRVEVLDIATDFEVPRATAALLARARGNVLTQMAASAIYAVEVPDTSVGLLIVDGELKRTLAPGLHAFWKFNRTVKVEMVDLRLQTMEVAGQEILTRDKVSLRVNLAATYMVTDAVKARKELASFHDHQHREQHVARREVSGARHTHHPQRR